MDDEIHKYFSKSLRDNEKQTKSTRKQCKHKGNKHTHTHTHTHTYIYISYKLFKSPKTSRAFKKKRKKRRNK